MKEIIIDHAPEPEQGNNDTQETNDERQKCNECEFKTRVRKYMKSRMMAHTGQCKCQTCKEAFKTTKILDEHIKSKHNEPNKSVGFR